MRPDATSQYPQGTRGSRSLGRFEASGRVLYLAVEYERSNEDPARTEAGGWHSPALLQTAAAGMTGWGQEVES